MAFVTPFLMTRDVGGYNGFGLEFTNTAYSASLAAATPTPLTVPTDGAMGGGKTQTKNWYLAIFIYEPGAIVWVANNATAAVPAGATFAATSSEMNPAACLVRAGDVLSFITATVNTDVSVLFYALN